MHNDKTKEAGPTPAQRIARATNASRHLDAMRKAMVKEKTWGAALAFCKAQDDARVARSLLPPLRLVSSCG
jgi:hypothetical protein